MPNQSKSSKIKALNTLTSEDKTRDNWLQELSFLEIEVRKALGDSFS